MLSAQPAKPSHICGHMGCEASKSPPSAEHVQLTGSSLQGFYGASTLFGIL